MRSLLVIFLTSFGLMASVAANAYPGEILAQRSGKGSASGKAPGAWMPASGTQQPAAPTSVQPAAQSQPATTGYSGAQAIESQPVIPPTSQPGQDQFENNPAETMVMICEQASLLRTTEAQLAQAQDAVSRRSFSDLVASRQRELKAVMSVYRKQTGRQFDPATQCARR